jgi:hypothetical protein
VSWIKLIELRNYHCCNIQSAAANHSLNQPKLT